MSLINFRLIFAQRKKKYVQGIIVPSSEHFIRKFSKKKLSRVNLWHDLIIISLFFNLNVTRTPYG